MISDLFLKILNMSLTASIAILVVLIARLVLRRAPRVFSYCLWAVVLFRLLCPVSFTTSFSLLGTVAQGQVEQGSITYISEELLQGPQRFMNGGNEEEVPGNPDISIKEPIVSTTEALPQSEEQTFKTDAWFAQGINVVATIWVLGMVALLIYEGRSLARLRKQLRRAARERENIYTSSLPTAFVMGLVRPRIYLPATLQGAEREYILLHEQVHIKRRDHVVKILAALALCIHWFNPLAWLAFYLSSKDMEMSCDEAVLRKIGPDVKTEYSASLLNLATGRRVITGMPLAFGEGDTGRRIKNVLKYKKPTTIAICVAVLVCVILGICLVSNPAGESHKELGNTIIDEEQQKEQDESTEQKEESHNESTEHSQREEVLDEKLFRLDIREISTENRTVDKYVYYPEWQLIAGDEPIRIAEECIFEANYRMDCVAYEEISFEAFAELIQKDWSTLCYATADERTKELTHIQVWSAQAHQGGYPAGHSNDSASWVYEDLAEQYGDTVLADFFTLESTYQADIADSVGVETIEVYQGVINEYEEVGILVHKNAEGKILGTEGIYAYPYPTTYYFNETSEGTYLLQIHVENRDTHGEYAYYVYRLSGTGDIQNVAGSRFAWDSSKIYDEEFLGSG